VFAHVTGADLADLEFSQFHPTALALPGADHDGTLLTEALRGEGATLLDASGRRFTDELAPRDELTAAILDRMGVDGTNHVQLDLRAIDPARFPNVFAACREAGLEPEREPVPVAPAAHYLIGGILSDLHGRTTLPEKEAVLTAKTGQISEARAPIRDIGGLVGHTIKAIVTTPVTELI
jgi:L-aspartate oxidase